MLRIDGRSSRLTLTVLALFAFSLMFTLVLIWKTNERKNTEPKIPVERNPGIVSQLKRQRPILTAECASRLGNQMFSYAILFAISIYNERDAYMSPSMSSYISKYFQASLGTLSRNLYNKIPWETRMIGADVPNDIRNLPVKRYGFGSRIKFCCHPQTWKYFDEIRPQILQEFQFHETVRRSAQEQLENAKEIFYSHLPQQQVVTFVGIHVRRGDYLKQQKECELPTVDFYKRAMHHFHQKYSNVLYILSSDDVGWCLENFRILLAQYKIHYINGTTQEDGGLDMAVLSNCDHVIFGLGTFGFWAAYLNPGEVIYCSNCVKPNSFWMQHPMIYGGDYNNFALPRWIGMTRNGENV